MIKVKQSEAAQVLNDLASMHRSVDISVALHRSIFLAYTIVSECIFHNTQNENIQVVKD